MEAVEAAEEEEVVVEAEVAEVPGKEVEGRPALDATPWLSLPRCQGQRREGQAVFHERHEIP